MFANGSEVQNSCCYCRFFHFSHYFYLHDVLGGSGVTRNYINCHAQNHITGAN